MILSASMFIERAIQAIMIDAELGPAPDGFSQKVKDGQNMLQVAGNLIHRYLWNNGYVDTGKRPRFRPVDHVVTNRRYHEYELWVVETTLLEKAGRAVDTQEDKQVYLLGIPDGRVYHLADGGQDLSESEWLYQAAESEAVLPELFGRKARAVRKLVIQAVKQERKRPIGPIRFLNYLIGRRLLGGVEPD